MYIHKCVKPGRVFQNRVLQVLKNAHNSSRIPLDHNFHRDVRLYKYFCQNSMALLCMTTNQLTFKCIKMSVYKGWEVCLPIPVGNQNLDIVHLEMINILVAVKLFEVHWKTSG